MVAFSKSLVGKVDKDGYKVLFQSGRWTVRQGHGGLFFCGDVISTNKDPLNGILYNIPIGSVIEFSQHAHFKKWWGVDCAGEFFNAVDYWERMQRGVGDETQS